MSTIKDLPLAFIDLETTGIFPDVHEILEIGVVRARQTGDSSSPLEEVDRFCLKIAPEHIERADPKALQVNHYRPEDWKDAVPFAEGVKVLDEKLRKHVIVAQNVSFDVGFLARAYERVGKRLDDIVHYHKLDLASFAVGRAYWGEQYQRFTLNELAQNTGVANTKAHTALSDAVATFEIACALLKKP
jgi:DNA polymerase III subunit epsilon